MVYNYALETGIRTIQKKKKEGGQETIAETQERDFCERLIKTALT